MTRSSKSPPTATPDPAAILALRELQIEGESDVVEELVGIYLATAPNYLREIDSAIASDQRGKLRDAAHTFKSCSATVGAAALATACRALENGVDSKSNGQTLQQLALAIKREFTAVEPALRTLAGKPHA